MSVPWQFSPSLTVLEANEFIIRFQAGSGHPDLLIFPAHNHIAPIPKPLCPGPNCQEQVRDIA